MDTAGQSLGLLAAAVCYSGLEMLQRKAAKKVKGRQVLQTYLGLPPVPHIDFSLGMNYYEEASLGDVLSGGGTFACKESIRKIMMVGCSRMNLKINPVDICFTGKKAGED